MLGAAVAGIGDDDADGTITRLIAVVSESLRFQSSNAPLLLPSQSLALSAAIHSVAAPLTRLLLLRARLPSPSSSSLAPISWFTRLAAAADDSDPSWNDAFHMSRSSFYLLVGKLSPALPVPDPQKSVAAALFRLVHSAPLRVLVRRFGFPSLDQACRSFYQVLKAAVESLGGVLDLVNNRPRVLRGFHALSLPGCCGALGHYRFPLSPNSGKSFIVQALVDAESRFLHISSGWPGTMNPMDILPRTTLYKEHSMFLGQGEIQEEVDEGREPPRYFLGSSFCPLLPWLITPIKLTKESSSLLCFNNTHSHGMEVVAHAFGMVKARWRLLQADWDGDCALVFPYIVMAGCLLHNFLIDCGEPLPELKMGVKKEEGFEVLDEVEDELGKKIRNTIASHLMLNREN